MSRAMTHRHAENLARRRARCRPLRRPSTCRSKPGQSVLDGLRWLRINKDPSLAVRYSCINANACKECMMQLDGETVYACTARLEPREMTLTPLPNKKLIRDLVTEIAPPSERFRVINRSPHSADNRRGRALRRAGRPRRFRRPSRTADSP